MSKLTVAYRLFFTTTLFTSVLFLFCSILLKGQEKKTLSLSEVHRFQPTVGAGFYIPAETSPTIGNSDLQNLLNYNLRIGFDYDFRPSKAWSVISSFSAFKQPVANARVVVSAEDIGGGETEDYNERFRFTSPLTFQFGLALRYQAPIQNDRFLEFRAGTFFHFFPEGSFRFRSSMTTSDGSLFDLVNLETTSREAIFKNGYSASTGIVMLKENHLIKLLVSFSFYRRNLVEGFYEFPDLKESGYSAGNYALSGSHFTFGCVFSWVKDKYRTRP